MVFIYGFDNQSNRIGTLERVMGGDRWRGVVKCLPVEADSRAGAENCLRHHGAVRVVAAEEAIHHLGIIIAV